MHAHVVILAILAASAVVQDSQESLDDSCDTEAYALAEEGESGYAPRDGSEGHWDACCEGTFSVRVRDDALKIYPIGCSVLVLPETTAESVIPLAWESEAPSVRIRAVPWKRNTRYQMDALGRALDPDSTGPAKRGIFRWNTSLLKTANLSLQQVALLAWSQEAQGRHHYRVFHPLAINGPVTTILDEAKAERLSKEARIKLTLRSSAPVREGEISGKWSFRNAENEIIEGDPMSQVTRPGQNLFVIDLTVPADGKLWMLEYTVKKKARAGASKEQAQDPLFVRAPTQEFMRSVLGLKQE